VVLTSGDKHKKDVTVIDFDPKDLESKPEKFLTKFSIFAPIFG